MKIYTTNHQDFRTFDDLQYQLQNVQIYNGYFTAICPFHTSYPVRNSLFIYPDAAHCKSCGIYFSSLSKLEYRLSKVVIRPIDESNQDVFDKPPFIEWDKRFEYVQDFITTAHKTAMQFPQLLHDVTSRGFTQDDIEKYRLGWMDKWIVIPVEETFVLRATEQLKNPASRYFNQPLPKQYKKPVLYFPSPKSKEADVLFVPFGIFDAMTFDKLGYPSCTGITGQEIAGQLFRDLRKPIYVVPDYGEMSGAIRLREMLDWRATILELDYPEGCKDINETLKLYGEKRCKIIIQEAISKTQEME